jgi:hypothetical protein
MSILIGGTMLRGQTWTLVTFLNERESFLAPDLTFHLRVQHKQNLWTKLDIRTGQTEILVG